MNSANRNNLYKLELCIRSPHVYITTHNKIFNIISNDLKAVEFTWF